MTRMNRTSWCLLYAAAVLAAALWHPAPPAAAQEGATTTTTTTTTDAGTVTFTAQGLPNPRATDVQSVASRRVLRAFLTEHPDIRIEPFIIPTIEGVSMDAGPLMAIAAGIPPHAMYVNFRQSSTYLQRGFLLPLETLLARILSDDPRVREADDDGNWLADPTAEQIAEAVELIHERVPEPAWPVVYRPRKAGGVPHAWALPTSNLVKALLYRKDLFAAAGLDPERPPENWDELLDYARRLTVPERRQYGMGLSGQLAFSTYSFLVSNGGRVVEQLPDGEWRAVWASEEAAEAYAFIWELVRGRFERDGQTLTGTTLFAGSELAQKWTRGEIGMQLAYLDEQMLADINPQLVGIAPVPVGPHGTRGSEVNARMFGVFAQATPQQQLAAMRYVWFRTGPVAERLTTDILVENGYGPFVNPTLLKTYGYDQVLRQVPKGWQEAFETSMAAGVPEPYGQNTQNVYRYLTRPIATTIELDLHDLSDEQRVSVIQRLLLEAQDEFNRKVLGVVPAEEMRTRRLVAGAVILGVAAAFIFGFVSLWRYFSHVTRQSQGVEKVNHRKYLWGYVLILPALVLIIGWSYLPLIGGAAMAAMDYQLVIDSTFIGVDNFAAALYDDRFWSAFGRTFYFVGLSLVLGFWPPILLAVLLDEVPTEPLKYFFRTVYYLPAIISGIIVIFLWKQLLEPYGMVNGVMLQLNALGPVAATLLKLVAAGLWLSFVWLLIRLPIKLDEMGWPMKLTLWAVAAAIVFGTFAPLFEEGFAFAELAGLVAGRFDFERVAWLRDPETAMLWCVIPSVWAASGPGCLLYLAALKTVPADLYEAAAIDGASGWHKVFYITLPRLKFLIVIQFIAAVVASFKGGANAILAMTGGGPNDATMVLALEIFTQAFLELEFGYAAAMAWMLGAVLIGFTAYQLRMLSKAEFKAGGA